MKKDLLHIIIDERQLQQLLRRYFDGGATSADLRWLDAVLRGEPVADFPITADTAAQLREALAVKAASAVGNRDLEISKSRNSGSRLRAIAAAVALLLVGAAVILRNPSTAAPAEQGMCLAYVGGRKVDDPDKVLSLMQSQLREMGDASDEVSADIEAQLDEMRQAKREVSNEKFADQ